MPKVARNRKPPAIESGIAHEKPGAERILKVTMRCLAHSDCDRLSMREIAEAAGVSKSLLHYHFKSKDALLLELVERFFDAMVSRIAKAASEGTLHTGTGPIALVETLDAIWRELRSSGDMPAIILRLSARGTLEPAVRRELTKVRTRLVEIMLTGARAAVGRALAETIPLEPLTNLMICALVGLESNRFFVARTDDLDRAFDLMKLLVAQVGEAGLAPKDHS
ncbi:MAG: TetR/AcrR family transcriptional regulator [Deltaproteobacteria bacterium]|nr:TetR/AcrR family transcriptional regulator [Deltaproteobacteria bacterium]